MAIASELMRAVPPCAARSTMREAAGRLATGDIDVLPVVDDEARRIAVGIISTAEVEACRAAGHDPAACLVERHLSRDFILAFPDDPVERTAAASGGPPVRAALVVGEDRRLLGLIPADGGFLRVTPAHKIEAMVGGWGGLELVWRCGDCGHTVARPASPPERCPDCGAPREHFVFLTED